MAHPFCRDPGESKLADCNQRLQQAYGNLPLSFEANNGQTASQVQYLSRGSGYSLFLTENNAVFSLTQPSSATEGTPDSTSAVALAMNLVGANPRATVTGLNQLSGTTNYFIGSNPSHWQTNIANYGQVEYQNVYSGVNLVYYGNQQQLEYDFVVAPAQDPNQIMLNFQGANSITLGAQGDLVLHTASGDLLQHAPVIYQEIGGVRLAVPGRFVLGQQDQVSFQVGAYDRSLPLTIDPILSYSTYLGGSNYDAGTDITVDGAGNAYVIGETSSADFPATTGAFQTSLAGSYDVFVTKLNANGSALVYNTYLGGSGDDEGYNIAVDNSGNAFITGETNSTNFPTTAGAFQATKSGSYEAFVTKLDSSGASLGYSTYLGGQSYDGGTGIAVDASGDAYVAGITQSSNFPTTPGAFQTTWSGSEKAFVTKLNNTGTALVYSTYLGGSSSDGASSIAVDANGNAYVTGFADSTDFPTTAGAFQSSHASDGGYTDAFVTKLNADGTALVYSTFLGGNHADAGCAIAVDSAGDAYVTGSTASTNFPTTAGAFQTSNAGGLLDAFVTKLNGTGTALVYSTYLGGSGEDRGFGIAVDSFGNAYVTGDTQSANFPTTADAFQASSGGGDDAFVTELNSSGSTLAYSTYLGGNSGDVGEGIAVDNSGSAYVTGSSYSLNFPTTTGVIQASSGGGNDAFIAKFSVPPPSVSSVVINQNISELYNAAGQPSPGVQRSMVEDIVYTFSEPVNILANSIDPNVFTIAVAPGWTGTVPTTIEWAPVAGSGNMQWEVDFGVNPNASGSQTGALNSIANGAYTITITDSASITALGDGQPLSLADDGIGGATQSFYRLFGDINGDEVVNAGDNNKFKQAMTTYNPAFDFNQDGVVNPADNLQFKSDLNVNFLGFTPTI